MPNGFSGTMEEFKEKELPLKRIDKKLLSFSIKHMVKIQKNYHNWPSRSLYWGIFFRRKMQIYLSWKNKNRYNFWICARFDKGKKRYLKDEFLKKDVDFKEIENNLDDLLEEGREKLKSWDRKDLTKVSDLR